MDKVNVSYLHISLKDTEIVWQMISTILETIEILNHIPHKWENSTLNTSKVGKSVTIRLLRFFFTCFATNLEGL